MNVGDIVFTKTERASVGINKRCVITKVEKEIVMNYRKGRWVFLETTERPKTAFAEFAFSGHENDLFSFEKEVNK